MIQITFTPETPEQTAAVAEAMVKYMAATAPGATVAEVKEPATLEMPKLRRKAEPTPALEEAAPITLEDVRGVLAKLSQNGKADAVKVLIAKFGAKKLTDITADKYADLMAQAEAL